MQHMPSEFKNTLVRDCAPSHLLGPVHVAILHEICSNRRARLVLAHSQVFGNLRPEGLVEGRPELDFVNVGHGEEADLYRLSSPGQGRNHFHEICRRSPARNSRLNRVQRMRHALPVITAQNNLLGLD